MGRSRRARTALKAGTAIEAARRANAVLNDNNSNKDEAPTKVDGATGTGSYTNTHTSGKKYAGKGTKERAAKSGREKEKEYDDPLVDSEWTSSENTRDAFKDESQRLDALGGQKDDSNYNKIESPGKKYRDQDSN